MFTEDLSAFFNTNEHATEALLDGVAVAGIFDNGTTISAGGVGMVTTDPSMTLATSAVPASPERKPLVIGSTTYTIVEHQPDGTGVSVLTLELA